MKALLLFCLNSSTILLSLLFVLFSPLFPVSSPPLVLYLLSPLLSAMLREVSGFTYLCCTISLLYIYVC